MVTKQTHLDLSWKDGGNLSLPLTPGVAESYIWRCPTCDHAVNSKVVVKVLEGWDPRRVLVDSLAGQSMLVQGIVSTCPRCGWTNVGDEE